MKSGLRRNVIPQRGFARMPLSSTTQPLECHPREFGAFYSPSTPPFSLLLSRSRLGRTEREPRTDRALGLFSSVAEVPHGRPLDPPSHARPIPRNRALPHARLAKLRLRGLHAMAGSSSPWRGSSASTPAMDHTTATTPTRTNKYTIPRSRRISNNEIPLIHCPDCMCRFLKVCTSKTEKNYDRQFYVCPTRTVRMVSCKFFM